VDNPAASAYGGSTIGRARAGGTGFAAPATPAGASSRRWDNHSPRTWPSHLRPVSSVGPIDSSGNRIGPTGPLRGRGESRGAVRRAQTGRTVPAGAGVALLLGAAAAVAARRDVVQAAGRAVRVRVRRVGAGRGPGQCVHRGHD